jgi:hypothetical protein
MSLAKRLFPKPGDSRRRRHFRALMLGTFLGLICSAMVAGLLFLLYFLHKQ